MNNLSEQQAAVRGWILNDKGSLNLVARAGCGKTFTLIRCAVRTIVEEGLGDIALMAYNKAAADEFKDRLAAMAKDLGNADFNNWKQVQTGTVHSFGFSAVRKWAGGNLKVDDKKVLTIMDDIASGFDLMGIDLYTNTQWEEIKKTCRNETAPVRQLVSLAKQAAFGFLVSIDDSHRWFELAIHHAVNDLTDDATMDQIVRAAQAVLRASIARDRDVVDFDDMVLAPLVHNLKLWPKDWVLIDEAQDTNASRRALALKMLKPRTGRLIAVGDDRQAIYGFTGADSDAMEIIAEQLHSKTLPLTVTYRCPKAVVENANRLVPDLVAHDSAPQGQVSKIHYTTVDAENNEVLWYMNDRPAADSAVLCRNTKPLLELAYSMLANGVGCRVEGREIGEGLVKLSTRWKSVTTLGQLDDKLATYKDAEVQKWQAKGREERAQGVEDKVDAILAISRALANEGKTQIADLVDWIRHLFGDKGDSDVVTLSTIHKSKGREWPTVYILFRDTTLPSPWARKQWQMNQEVNLEYVAITRAKDRLVFID